MTEPDQNQNENQAYGQYPPPGPQQQHQQYVPGPPPQQPGVGAKLVAFFMRDMVAFVAGIVTVVVGIALFISPRLAWIVDRSFDMVDGTMTLSATGSIGLNATAQRSLDDSDAYDLGLFEMALKIIAEPIAGMLTLSALLVLIGGLLMVTTARRLGAVFALMGVVPQVVIVIIGAIVGVLTSEDSPPSPTPIGEPADAGFGVGAGLIITVIAYLIVIACAVTVAVRKEDVPRRTAPVQ